MKTILVILAHPDDESFGPGATLAKYVQSGVAVHYLCGTRGESGTVDAEKLNGYKDIAELRTAELACAAKELGLAGVHFLGYRDSGMAGSEDNQINNSLNAAGIDEVAERIMGYLDEIKPDVVLTHDQYGGYGHPDHIKLHYATRRAYELKYGIFLHQATDGRMEYAEQTVKAVPAAPRMYYPVFPKSMAKFGVWLMPLLRQDPTKFGRNKDINLAQIASWEVPVTCKIDIRPWREVKKRASACHASQSGPGQAPFIVRMLFRLQNRYETFARAYPPTKPGERFESGF